MIFAIIIHVEFCSAMHVWDYLAMFFELCSASGLEPREKKLEGIPETSKFPEVQICFTASCVRPID